ncbi:hypothetical protein F4821DRAFT_258428 [Hypoxylon rubiginosum]|uniref:Uncharacterized protein n=1 Tax=Hypoxylon rubiginosum TaxID=110542 RepID=A0ACC0D5E4_9PEZI|nr:hypothetical protein F4821DRAFT_258428 [Hypoxylon rubiginosum]
MADAHEPGFLDPAASGMLKRVTRKVVPGMPRAKTWKRQQSEEREKLEAIQPTSAERRAVSVDRRLQPNQRSVSRVTQPLPRASAPDFLDAPSPLDTPTGISQQVASAPELPLDEKQFLSIQDLNDTDIDTEHHESLHQVPSYNEAISTADAQSTTTSQYEAVINEELERKWILNLSMHFRDKSRREKFFVTYREDEYEWRRVTISLDYRNAPDDSLEKDLLHIKFQREKSAKIYEAIRDSLQDIQFYPTVTNLKLQTTEGRLHVHVVEDVNEIINYPTVRMIQHLDCRRIRERDLVFDSHMSGFVYKVRVDGKTLIKKEIPGPDTVDEFLYEVNALNSLRFSHNIIEFYGVVVDDNDESVKGLLINYAEKGALIDVIYDSAEDGNFMPWSLREKWAKQIVQGLSDVHEAGFVQGDLTLSNIVIDDENNAKIIDINRRGCPVGWEPPEATPLIDSNQRISMYIGVKSDLYQLGMVLWALATLEDEPEAHRRPLQLDPEIEVPPWYRSMVAYCLHDDPRVRLQATELLRLFPQTSYEVEVDRHHLPAISVDDGYSLREYTVDDYQHNGHPQIRTVEPRNAWSYAPAGHTHTTSPGFSDEPYYPSRGRSPPRSLPSNHDMYSPPYMEERDRWPNNFAGPSTDDAELGEEERAETPRKVPDTAEVMANLQRDLSRLEAGQAHATGGENQAKGATSAGGAAKASGIADGGVEKALPLTNKDADAVTPVNSSTTPAVLGKEKTIEHSQPETPREGSKQKEVLMGEERRDMNTGAAIDTPTRTEGAAHTLRNENENENEGEETGSLNNYTHDRRDMPAQSSGASPSRVAESPSTDIPAELTGIGTAYDASEENRTPVLPDEDLGLPPTTTASAKVATFHT